MTVKEFIKEAITIGDADDLLQFLTEKDFSVIDADFPIESHLAALLEYRGYDEEMDGIDDYYIELHFNYCLDSIVLSVGSYSATTSPPTNVYLAVLYPKFSSANS